MSINNQNQQLVNNLNRLAKDFTSNEPAQAAELKRAFKESSKNDLSRTVVYLMEVVGISDMRVKQLLEENKDLRELLKVNNIELEGESSGQTADGQGIAGTTDSSALGSNSDAASAGSATTGA